MKKCNNLLSSKVAETKNNGHQNTHPDQDKINMPAYTKHKYKLAHFIYQMVYPKGV